MRNQFLHACAAFAVTVLPVLIATSVPHRSDTSFPSIAITDSSPARIPNAKVTGCNEATQNDRRFAFPNFQSSRYSARVEAGMGLTLLLN